MRKPEGKLYYFLLKVLSKNNILRGQSSLMMQRIEQGREGLVIALAMGKGRQSCSVSKETSDVTVTRRMLWSNEV